MIKMSINLSNIAVTEFDAMVKAEYQAQGWMLRDTVRVKDNITGKTVKFPVMGRGIATSKIPQDDVTPMNVNYSFKTGILTNWNAAEYSDIFDEQEVNIDDKRELASCIAFALGRRSDQLVIDANSGSGTTKSVAIGTSNMTYAKFLEAESLLNYDGVPRNERTLIMSTAAERSLLADDKFINNDYIKNNVLNKNGLHGQTVLDTRIIVIPEMSDVGGLPGTIGGARKCYMYHKQALGLGVGINFKTEINYIPNKTSWLVNGIYKAIGIAIDPLGIVEINIDESK